MIEPPWLAYARTQLGVREAPGAANEPRIMAWAKRTAKWLGIAYTADSVPWCGLFVAECMVQAGITPPPIAVRAKAWLGFGKKISPAAIGAVMVFDRAGGGHVALYIGEDPDAYHVLGGNQGDAVTITRISRSRLLGIRYPWGYEPGQQVAMSAKGGFSQGEA